MLFLACLLYRHVAPFVQIQYILDSQSVRVPMNHSLSRLLSLITCPSSYERLQTEPYLTLHKQ